MLTNRTFWASRSFPLLAPPDGEGGGSGGNGDGGSESAKSGAEGEQAKDGEGDGEEEIAGLGDAGKAALKKERDARKAAADALKDAQKKLADLEKEKSDREAAEAAAKDEEAAKKGEFETLAEKRRVDLEAAKADVTRLTAEADQFKAAMAEGIKAGWKELPEEVRKLGEKSHPEDDVLGRWTFLNDPDTKALVAKLTDKADTRRGNGHNPKSSGDGKLPDADKRKAQAPMYQQNW